MNGVPESSEILLEIRNLEKHFSVGGRFGGSVRGVVRAVDGISLAIRQGEVLGLLGESGCGKSTTARTILGLARPTGGSVLLQGRDIRGIPSRDLRSDVQIIFQDPTDSLNPSFRVRDIIAEALRRTDAPRGQWPKLTEELLASVGLDGAMAAKYPRQLSGGQGQRVGIARALAMRPRLIIADEPVSALDVSVQAQILNLFIDLKERFGLTYLFISHDFNVLRYVCDRVAVMYLGRIVETGSAATVFERPEHPYTEALLNAVPTLGARPAAFTALPRGELPSALKLPTGCRYHPRCVRAAAICRETEPVLEATPGASFVACHFPTSRSGSQGGGATGSAPDPGPTVGRPQV